MSHRLTSLQDLSALLPSFAPSARQLAVEARYPFDETAVYSCALIDFGPPPDSYWSRDGEGEGA